MNLPNDLKYVKDPDLGKDIDTAVILLASPGGMQ
jgi:hypothetical protein